ncbi:MAG: sigma-70 family RNA polymerase sigma factor [candidate division Zixibacteria bacterium]|nr:sigma-70 family RNA polymerase sigma factor [candidate division Zixibacteria bacterium]
MAIEKKKDKRFGEHFVDYYPCFLGGKGKKKKRIRNLDWVLSGAQESVWSDSIDNSFPDNSELRSKVRKAVEKLPPLEKKFIQSFYFEFKTYAEIAKILNKKIYKLDRIHRQALSKLKIILKDYVQNRFKIDCADREMSCPICSHPQKEKMDEVIESKTKSETWKRIIKILREEFGLMIKTPQVLISHKSKHIVKQFRPAPLKGAGFEF